MIVYYYYSDIPITFCVKVLSKTIMFKLHIIMHNNARAMMDMKREVLIVSINIGYRVWDVSLFPAFHNMYVGTIHCS